MRKYVVEFIGTFFLVTTIGCTVIARGTGAIPPLAIGGALMVLVFAGGHISGAHYNPAVTLAVYLRGRCPAGDVLPYVTAQLAAAVTAAVAVRIMTPGASESPFTFSPGPALVAEFLFTFALVWVVLNVATAKGTAGNSFYGLAIGMTVMAGAFAVGPISGAAFNPAVAVGAAAMNILSWSSLWLYFVAELAGAVAAALAFNALSLGEA